MNIAVLIYILIVIGVILVSMTFHEAMHAYASYWLGDDTARLQGRLSLNPIKHIDPFLTILLPLLLALSGGPIFGGAKPVPFNPHKVKYDEWGAAMVAIAGPITNFLLAFVLFGVMVLLNLPAGNVVGQIILIAIQVNLGFFIFNMVPIPPLDGSRVLYALAPEFARRIMERLEAFGIVVVLAIIILAGSRFGEVFQGAIDFFLLVFARLFGVN